MASLFSEQASVYAAARPRYPPELFQLLASLTKGHKRAWDVGTGNGQAAVGVADYYEEVIATDVSEEQLRFAEKRPNISYRATSAGPLSQEEVARVVGEEGSLDLITVAQAIHWFDLPSFYGHVRRLLRKPGGILAVWCYTGGQVNVEVDAVLVDFYNTTLPFWDPAAGFVNKGYQTLHFPFQPVLQSQLSDKATPICMDATKEVDLEGYFGFIESWSAVNTARAKGVELLGPHVKEAFEHAWVSPSQIRTMTFRVYARIGTPF